MKYLLIATILFVGTLAVNAQTECPQDKVCLTREAGLKALQDSDTVKAQATEIATLNQAIADQKKIIEDLKVQFANVSGANSELRQAQVRTDAIISILVANSRKKCISVICL